MELMVVVVLVSLLAALAIPSFSEARNDRIAFDYARQYQQVLVQGRSRAAGTGSAHLAILKAGAASGNRGFIHLYQGLDGTAAAATPPGPNPVSSCKLDPVQWAEAETEPANLVGVKARFIDFADLNRGGVNATMDVRAELTLGSGSSGTAAVTGYLAICITPSGVTYVGSGTTPNDAITVMRGASPFTGVAEVLIQRHLVGGAGIGLQRRVVITGGGAPRLRSQ